MKENIKKFITENTKVLIYALIIAVIIRSFLFQPFKIPSSSMEPNLLVGDRLFVSKYSYGYSRHSLPFSPKITNTRYLYKHPERGDVVVFKTPADNRTDYIKRLIGLPGDTIQFIDGQLFLNNNEVPRIEVTLKNKIYCGNEILDVKAFIEKLPNKKEYLAVYRSNGTLLNTDKYKVPSKHYFFLGDNRDCSQDSRFLTSVGYVSYENLVGKARVLFFSHDQKKDSLFNIINWNNSLRFNRFFKKIN